MVQQGDPDLGGFRPLRTEHLKQVVAELMSRDHDRGDPLGDEDDLSKAMWDRVAAPKARSSGASRSPWGERRVHPGDSLSPAAATVDGSYDKGSGTIVVSRGSRRISLQEGRRYNLKAGSFERQGVPAVHAAWVAMVSLANGLAFDFQET